MCLLVLLVDGLLVQLFFMCHLLSLLFKPPNSLLLFLLSCFFFFDVCSSCVASSSSFFFGCHFTLSPSSITSCFPDFRNTKKLAAGSPPCVADGKLVSGRVSSDVEALEMLHQRFGWVPGRSNIRPTPAAKIAKERYLLELRTSWTSESDYILATVFGFAPERDPNTGRQFVPDHSSLPFRRVFDRNAFPYDLPAGTRHSLMWYTRPPPGGDTEITSDIAAALQARTASRRFEFVYYTNPKKTIPDLCHVQVFWHCCIDDN